MISSVKTLEVTQLLLQEMVGFMLKDLTVGAQEAVVQAMVLQILKTPHHPLVEQCHLQTARKNAIRPMDALEFQLDFLVKMALTLATVKLISIYRNVITAPKVSTLMSRLNGMLPKDSTATDHVMDSLPTELKILKTLLGLLLEL
jgi:hypothetical protein